MSGYRELSPGPNNAQGASVCAGTKSQKEKLTQKRVRELFDYDPETGLLTRKCSVKGSGRVGSAVGSLNKKGYLTVGISNKKYLLHRVIWLWQYGYFPEYAIDHISRDRTDNRLHNLREVSFSCNSRNCKVYSTNKSGVRGVCKSGESWQVFIRVNKDIRVQLCKDFTEAVAHRLAAEQCLGYSSCDNQSSAFVYMQNYIKEKKAEFEIPPS